MAVTQSRRTFLQLAAAGTAAVALPVGVQQVVNPPGAAAAEVPGVDRVVASVCEMCTVRCPILVRVRDGKVVRIEGNPKEKSTQGAICARGNSGISLLEDRDRVRTPLIRVGERGEGRFREATWDEALAFAGGLLTISPTPAMTVIDIDGPGKTLIFAASSEHADMVVIKLKEAYKARLGEVDPDAIVKITGVASSCNREQEGSGWVVSPERVVTNAHVVAGTTSGHVRIQGVGRTYGARVVIFDPRRDLAVLAVPGLPARSSTQGPDLKRAGGAVVAGFPLNGPYRLDAARVRDVLTATGSDIYGSPGAVREVYSLFARVQPGNSGGPLLSPSGAVVGIVFARSIDDDKTGYALTLDEARPVLDAADSSSSPVSTGDCVAG